MRTFIVILFFIPFLSTAQFNFQEGHIVLKNGEKKEGYIKKKNWTNNPFAITFRNTKDGRSENYQTSLLNEIEVYGIVKYQRFDMLADLSSDATSRINSNRELEYEKQSILLKALVQGEKSLYTFRNNGSEKFFFKTDATGITQLVYKKYTFRNDPTSISSEYITENKGYIRQLKGHIACSYDSDIKIPDFKKSALIKYFITNNNCSGDNSTAAIETSLTSKNKGSINFVFNVGLNSSKLEAHVLGNNNANDDLEYEQKLHPMIGFGVRAKSPNKRVSVLADVNYNFAYESDNQTDEFENTVSYPFLRIQFGGRYHVLFGEDSSFFLGPYFVVNNNLNGNITPQPSLIDQSFNQTVFNIALGGGFQIGKLELDFRYSFKDDPLRQAVNGTITNFTIGASYAIF
ncbi:hypothetical protein M3P19_03990 [Muricauda sp. 2012CJ35-5]|uniref:Outer membrane protein beta-barrel domain-containing protein n=1 Tax=Flagellimonas spongiicola TaxID=2942208 RepID=A0ABT0PP44_9FLAO|nr:hypothetical protein [Allomuricauda spongiicola]MCL6273154.1 hypothetical protein [Allomuricauda spongiicola]